MSIGLAAERIATSLKQDTWVWNATRLIRSDAALAVSLKGDCYANYGGYLGFDPLPMNKAERKLLAKIAGEKYQTFIAELANSPAKEPKQ
jgi:hypothetical protein